MKPRIKKLLSMLLTAAMVLNMGLTPVFAAEGVTPPGVSGVCIHHTEHTEDCGYQQGTPCNHVHTEDCYTKELTCALTEGETPETATGSDAVVDGGEPAQQAAHTHGEDCYTQAENCNHEHDNTCSYTPDTACRFDAASCTQCKPANQAIEKVCTCPPVDSGELVHGKDCPLYTAPEWSEAVKALIAMVDALPEADTITDENRETAKPAFDAAARAYEALSDEDKAAFEATTQHEKLMALHTALYPVVLMTNEAAWDISTGTITLDNTCGADCAHTVTGTSTDGKIIVQSGTHNVTLNGVDIQFNDGSEDNLKNGTAAFEITGGAAVNLTLTGTNTLKSGVYKAGLQVQEGNTLTITDTSTGSLSTTGGARCSGIGGGSKGPISSDTINGGTVTINGGTITAIGGDGGAGIGGGTKGSGGTITISGGTVSAQGGHTGSGIGGGNKGAGGNITISGGTVTASGGRYGSGIGGGQGEGGGTITIDGNAVVYALKGVDSPNHIGAGHNASESTVAMSSGIVFEGNIGAVYGWSVTPTDDFTIPLTHMLIITAGQTVDVSDITATNNGTIISSGTIIGNIINIQPVKPSATVTLDIAGEDKYVNITRTGYTVGTAAETPHFGGYVITGTQAGTNAERNHVMVSSGTHNITLKDADIQLSTNDKCAFAVKGNSTVNLTLEGTNVLKSGTNRAGLEATDGNTLTITEESTGCLRATGGESGAGIGGGKNGKVGTIAIGGNAVIYAQKGSAAPAHMGSGAGALSAAVKKNGGIIFEGETGTVYGTVTLQNDLTITADQTLIVGTATTLIIPESITTTNNGTITNHGTIVGKIVGKQPVESNGKTHAMSESDFFLNALCGNGTCVGHEVTGTTNANKISVNGGTHDITLNNVNIDVSGKESFCAFEIVGDATVNLTLEGSSTLKSGKHQAGLQVEDNNKLMITATSTGSLTANGGNLGAGIGGGFNGAGGNITVNGGTVTANGGDSGAGIGGGNNGASGTISITGGTVAANGGNSGAGIGGGTKGAGGTISISGGTVTGIGSTDSAGIGGGYQGVSSTITIDGNAVVYATKGTSAPNHIGAGANYTGALGTVRKAGGIVFEGTAGSMCAATVTPKSSFTIPTTHTLTIDSEKTLTMNSGTNLTNNGTLVMNGTVTGTGSYTGSGNVNLVKSMVKPPENFVYTGTAKAVSVKLLDYVFAKDSDYTVTYADNTEAGEATATVTPQGSKLTGSAVDKTFTITKSASELGLTSNKTDNTFTYGETITFTATVSIPATRGRSAAVDTVNFYCDGTKLNGSPITLTESGGTGTATFTYDTTSKKIPAGEDIEITAEYGGSGNLNGVTQTVKITLNPMKISANVNGYSKAYDGNVYFTNRVARLEQTLPDGDDFTVTTSGELGGADVSDNHYFICKEITYSGKDESYYQYDDKPIYGTNIRITRIDPTITVETDKASHLGGKEITVTIKITNPADATSGFPEASEIAIAPTNATLKTALAQQGTTGVYTATYTLGAYSAGAKAKFVATVPNETQNYNANTTGATSADVEILDKYTPTVEIMADKTDITYGESVTLTATVGKNGQTSPLAGTVQFDHNFEDFGVPVAIDANGKAALTVGKETLTVGELHRFDAQFIPESGSDYKEKYSNSVSVQVNPAKLNGVVTIDGTPIYGETLTANTSKLSGVAGDTLGEFDYQWYSGGDPVGSEKTYTIQEADIDKIIYVYVIPKSGNYFQKLSTTVKPTKADSTLTITGDPTKTYDGTAVGNPATTQTGNTGAVTFDWHDAGGKLDSAPKNAGSYSVRAMLAETATHAKAEATKAFTITAKATNPTIEPIDAVTYDGTAKEPTLTVKDNGTALISGTDYTAVYSNNTNAGTGKVVVTLKGNYSGTENATFAITKAAAPTIAAPTNIPMVKEKERAYTFDLSTLAMPQNAGTKSYAAASPSDASLFTANPTVDADGKTLNFTSANVPTADGTSTVVVTITSGNYADTTVTLTFEIVSKTPVAISGISVADRDYNGKAIAYTGTPIAKDDKSTVTVSGYDYTWSKAGTPLTEAPRAAGDYKLTVSVMASDTQYIGSVDVPFTISKAALTIKADNQTMTQGDTLPTFTVNISELAAPDTAATTFTTQPLATCTADGNTVGTFDITIATKAVLNGTVGANYTIKSQDNGTLTVNELLYSVTLHGGGSGAGNYAPGATVSIHAGSNNGDTFSGWTADPAVTFADASSASTTFVMPSNNVTVTAKWSHNGGSSDNSSSGDNPTPPSENKPDPKPPVIEESNAKINSDKDGNVTAKADDKEIAKAIEKAQKADKGNGIAITLNVKTKEDTKSLAVTLQAGAMTALTNAKVTQLTINNGLTTITLDLAALNVLKGGDVVLTITKADVKTLSAEAQNAIGNRPVFRFGATVGSKAVTYFKGGRVGLQMPYTRTTTEQAGNLVGVYVDENGKLTWLENSSYDSLAGTLLTSTTHFSVFGVGYKAATAKFTDVGTHWAKNDIDFVVARGLLTGTSNTTFAPDTSMTRGMFVTSLGRLAGVDTKKYQSTKFTDVVATAYYSPYVAWASANNIVNGTSDTTFSPDKAISRQEMAVMLVNYSKAIGYKLPGVHAEVSFVDAGSIGTWAKDAVKQTQMAGILMGKSGNRFDPTATATRAEVSAMLRRYVELVASTETAEGWAMNESGQWMYVQDGKRIIGKKTIDGKSYTFDQHGVTTALPPERKYLTYTVQKGDSFWAIASKYKVNIFELVSLNGKTIFSTIHPGDELKVPQK